MGQKGMYKMKKIKVSILCLAYNHANFIRKCLDGFVMQKTNFPFEVIIHDDASTDGTADIIREYAEKYPDIIKPILQTENQWSRGINIWKTHMWPRISGEYVAVCDGDDYWTDPKKLQRQVDFLDRHLDYSMCFHPVCSMWEDKHAPDHISCRARKHTLELADLLKSNRIPNCAVMYRWRRECQDLFPNCIFPGDWYLHMLHAQIGKIGYLPKVMSVYRRNSGGVWTGANETDDWFIKFAIPSIDFYKHAMKQFNYDYTNEIAGLVAGAVCAFLHTDQMDKVNMFRDMYAEIWPLAKKRINAYDINAMQKRAKKYQHMFNNLLIGVASVIVMCIILAVILFL